MSEPTSLQLAASFSDTALGMLARGRILAIAFVIVLAILSVGMTWTRTRSWIPSIGMGLLGGFAVWLVTNVSDVKSRAGEEITESDADSGAFDSGDLGEDNVIAG